MTPDYQADGVRLYREDCRQVLPKFPTASFDLVFTDPPYPEIDRPYGRLTEAEWFELMRRVVPEVRRVLKPSGSAVFVLQPNSERVGRMRTWLWEFLAWVGREWGVVQDAYWWNTCCPPLAGANICGLMRPSAKTCAWLGPPDCYRDQRAVLLSEAEGTVAHRLSGRVKDYRGPSGRGMNTAAGRAAAARRGGTTPFNVLPVGNPNGGSAKHPSSTPARVCDWWLRYVCPPGGSVLDPFAGSGTTGVAALRQGKTFVGVEKEAGYVDVACKRLSEANGPLFAPREVTADG